MTKKLIDYAGNVAKKRLSTVFRKNLEIAKALWHKGFAGCSAEIEKFVWFDYLQQ